MSYALNRYFDPLYGRVALTEFEFALIRSPEFQRLRYIRLCNINSMLISGASEISRFEHCLGVLRLAKEWLAAHPLNENDEKAFIAAALLHDLQTGPFGHSFQYILEDNQVEGNFLHDDIVHGYRSQYHQSLLASASFAGHAFSVRRQLGENLWQLVGDLIRGIGPLGALIAGSLDLDNIDNVIRLAFHVGIVNANDRELPLRLTRDLRPDGEVFSISMDGVTLIEKWQAIRRRLYELLLLDWAEFSAKGMLTRALEIATEHKIIGSESWLLTDDELISHLDQHSTGDQQDIREFVRRLRVGDLYTPIILLRSSSTHLYNEIATINRKRDLEARLIKTIKKKAGVPVKLFIHFILDKRKTDRSVKVIVRPGSITQTIGIDSNSLLIGVFSSKPASVNVRSMLENCVIETLSSEGLNDLIRIEDPTGTDQSASIAPQMKLI